MPGRTYYLVVVLEENNLSENAEASDTSRRTYHANNKLKIHILCHVRNHYLQYVMVNWGEAVIAAAANVLLLIGYRLLAHGDGYEFDCKLLPPPRLLALLSVAFRGAGVGPTPMFCTLPLLTLQLLRCCTHKHGKSVRHH